MILNRDRKEPLLIVGDGKLAFSVAVCFLQSGHPVTLCTADIDHALQQINRHFSDLTKNGFPPIDRPLLKITGALDERLVYPLAVVLTEEHLAKKRSLIGELETKLPPSTIIAINSESIPLSVLHEGAKRPGRVIGVNWAEPAHTTYFMEIIANDKSDRVLVNDLLREAKTNWNKDPYLISHDLGIRGKMMAAMTREAFYLVENGFASIEDIDRACRNDPGYYLPFAGNFRYMDLMGGASGFGRVMKALNPELSKARVWPQFFTGLIQEEEQVTGEKKGFYPYAPGEAEKWEQSFRNYSYQIGSVIKKYAFGQPRADSPDKKILLADESHEI